MKPVLDHSAKLCLVMGETGTEPSHRERGSNHHGIAGLDDKCERSINRFHDNALCDIGSTVEHQVFENLPIFAPLNRLEFCSDEFNVVLRQDSLFVKCHCGVQRGLATKCRQNSIGFFLGDNRFDCYGRDWLNVGRVREIGIRHDGRRIRIDEDDPNALLAKDPAGLSTRIIELGRLANDNWP
ncbi:unannotated protein [freshwater metagenome]|uniref:Unannotated protein n=1 Tax=freshwater metagenome TaxID=449393 RepID=A0A6J6AYY5_9ZZZZ